MYKIFERHKRFLIPGLLCMTGSVGLAYTVTGNHRELTTEPAVFTCLDTKKGSPTDLSNASETTKITLNPSSMSLKEGETGQFTVTFTPADAETTLTWISGDPSIAEVNDDGVVTAVSPGIAIIYAQAENGATGMAVVEVINTHVVSINITPENLTLELDESAQLTAHIEPGTAVSEITWSSGDPSVAVVSDDGLVTAVGKGATFIYATSDNGVTGIATVTVMNGKEVTSVTVIPENIEMVVGGEEQLEVEVKPATATPEITWLSTDTSIADVNDEGVVSAISPGITIIYALSDNGVTGFATVKVVSNEVTSVIIDPDLLELELDETGQLIAIIEPAAADAVITWSSSDTSIATIDNDGMVKAKEPGYTFIYATSDNGVTGLAVVKVKDPEADDNNPNPGYGDNGVFISAIRIREGDPLGLFAERPTGFENNDWTYEWYLNGNFETAGKNVIVTAGKPSDWKGDTQDISIERYQADILNNVGDEIILELPDVRVYSRPLTPVELLRKGDGNSHTFIAMSSFSDAELSKLGYWFVFGYTDEEGVNHIISNSQLRYCETSREIYNNEGYRFWVYTTWTFPDGATITSGLRYLDGSENERFDRSDFNLTRASGLKSIEGETETMIYTIEGHFMGNDLNKLTPGIYIIRERKGSVISTGKIIKR